MTSSGTYRPNELRIVALSGQNLPSYPAGEDGYLKSEVCVEVTLLDKTVRTPYVFIPADGRAYFRKKWRLKLSKRSLVFPLIIKARDRKLGVIASTELRIDSLPICTIQSAIEMPRMHWSFAPESDEMTVLKNHGFPVHINENPCEIELVVVIRHRRRLWTRLRYRNRSCWNCYSSRQKIKPIPEPPRRTRRWIVEDEVLKELEWDNSKDAHEWTALLIGHRVNYRRDIVSALDRRGPNRQAFLRRKSDMMLVDLLGNEIAFDHDGYVPPVPIVVEEEDKESDEEEKLEEKRRERRKKEVPEEEEESVGVAGGTTLLMGTESGQSAIDAAIIERADKRLIGQERSLTEIMDTATKAEGLHEQIVRKSYWNSMPNAYLESGSHGAPIREVLSKRDYHDETGLRPIITKVYPRRVPVSAFATVTVIGHNFGESQEEIFLLAACGLNCRSTVEYLSRDKVRFTTRPFVMAKGCVAIGTVNGGRGESPEEFEFYDAADLSYLHRLLTDADISVPDRIKYHERAWEKEIGRVVEAVATTETFNLELQQYLKSVERKLRKTDLELYKSYKEM